MVMPMGLHRACVGVSQGKFAEWQGKHDHATSHRWEASNGKPGVGDLYLSVMDAVDAVDDRAVYFIEGAGQQSFVTAWGDGFVTDSAIISQNKLSDPRPFFDALLKKAYVDRVRAHVIAHPMCQNPSV